MPLLKHQLILHPDIVSQFELDKPVTNKKDTHFNQQNRGQTTVS